ncbi:MAG: hypothetical protein QXP66_00815 [Candidatus Aenigmatarchaeota archaeon]
MGRIIYIPIIGQQVGKRMTGMEVFFSGAPGGNGYEYIVINPGTYSGNNAFLTFNNSGFFSRASFSNYSYGAIFLRSDSTYYISTGGDSRGFMPVISPPPILVEAFLTFDMSASISGSFSGADVFVLKII